MKMRHEVPTHLEVQDHFLGNLTIRQILCIGIGLALGYSVWLRLGHAALVLALCLVAVIGLVTLVVTFVRPQGRDLEDWAVMMLRYSLVPKRCVWRRRAHGRSVS